MTGHDDYYDIDRYERSLGIGADEAKRERIAVRTCDLLANGCRECTEGSYLEEVTPAVAYARGITLATVSLFMTIFDWDWHKAVAVTKFLTAQCGNGSMGRFTLDAVPESWRDQWEKIKPDSTEF